MSLPSSQHDTTMAWPRMRPTRIRFSSSHPVAAMMPVSVIPYLPRLAPSLLKTRKLTTPTARGRSFHLRHLPPSPTSSSSSQAEAPILTPGVATSPKPWTPRPALRARGTREPGSIELGTHQLLRFDVRSLKHTVNGRDAEEHCDGLLLLGVDPPPPDLSY